MKIEAQQSRQSRQNDRFDSHSSGRGTDKCLVPPGPCSEKILNSC